MKNKEKLLKDIEEYTEYGDLKSYIFICDKGCVVYGDKHTMMSDLTTFLNWQLLETKKLTKKDIDEMCRLAKLDNDEVIDEFKDKLNKAVNKAINNNKFDELEKLIKKIGDEIKNG